MGQNKTNRQLQPTQECFRVLLAILSEITIITMNKNILRNELLDFERQYAAIINDAMQYKCLTSDNAKEFLERPMSGTAVTKAVNGVMMHIASAFVEVCKSYYTINNVNYIDNPLMAQSLLAMSTMLGSGYIENLFEFEYDPTLKEYVRVKIENMCLNYDNETVRLLLARDVLLQASNLFVDLIEFDVANKWFDEIVGFDEVDESLVPTSLVRTCYAPVHKLFSGTATIIDYMWLRRNAAQLMKDEAIDVGLSYMIYRCNPTLTTAFLLFLKHIHRVFKTTEIISEIIEFAKKMICLIGDKSKSAVSALYNRYYGTTVSSQDQTEEESLVATNDLTLMADSSSNVAEFISTFGDDVTTVISLFMGVVFTCVAAGLGYSTYCKDVSSSFLKKLGNVGLSYSGVSRGVDGLLNLSRRFRDVVDYCITYFVGKKDQHRIMTVVLQCGVEDRDTFKKVDFIDHINFLIDPENQYAILASDEHKAVLEKCDEVAIKVLTDIAEGQTSLSREGIAWLTYIRNELKKLRTTIFRFPRSEPKRFTPMWINLVGSPGTGKSVLVNDIADTLANTLYALDKKYEMKPCAAENRFNKNFADKFMTGYSGQAIVTIDDVFQDTGSMTAEQSSAIQLINYISSVPYHPVQASLEDKGMKFNSKIVITSSNCEVPQRNEIVSIEALLTRIRLMLRVVWKAGVCSPCKTGRGIELCEECALLSDPVLKRPIQFEVLRLSMEGGSPSWHSTGYRNWRSLRKIIVKAYIKYWEHEHEMLNKTCDAAAVSDLVQELKEELVPTGLLTLMGGITDACTDAIADYVWRNPKKGWLALKNSQELDALYQKMCVNTQILEAVTKLVKQKPEETVEEVTVADYFDNLVVAKQLVIVYTESEKVVEWYKEFNKCLRTDAKKRINRGHVDMDIIAILAGVMLRYKADMTVTMHEARASLLEMKAAWSASIIGGVMGAAVATFIGFIGYKTVGAVQSYFKKENIEPTSIRYSNGPRRAKLERIRVERLQPTYDTAVDNNVDNASENLLASMFKHGTMCCMEIENGNEIRKCTAVRVAGRFILTNAHNFDNLETGLIKISIPTRDGVNVIQQVFDSARLHRLMDDYDFDAILYECDAKMPSAKDITSHFLHDEVDLNATSASLMSVNRESMIPCVYDNIIACPKTTTVSSYATLNGNVEYSALGYYQFNLAYKVGMSGSLMIAQNARMPRKLMGIQACGNTKTKLSYIIPITKTMLKRAMGRVVATVDDEVMEACCEIVNRGEPPNNLAHCGLKYIGMVPRSHQMPMAVKTKFEPSLVHDESELTQEPAVLSNNDKRMREDLIGQSVMFRNIEKFDKPCGFVRPEVLETATHWLSTWYATTQSLNYSKDLLTEFETVNGVYPYLKQLDMRTSPGYPFVKQRQVINSMGKFEWFDEDVLDTGEKVYKPKSILVKRMEDREKDAQCGIETPTIAYACLKDETRPIEKIHAGKTRVFLCMPMDFNLLTRKYFGNFIIMMHSRAAAFISSCVGIDPCAGWTSLARRLKSVGSNFEDFDYSGWDTLIHPEFFQSFAKIVNAWYDDGEENARVREMIMYQIAHTYFIAGNRMFQKGSGTCSGFALTAECNSIINELIMLYCWIILAFEHDQECLSMEQFLENCALGVYGDDIVKSVSQYAKWFNGNNIKPIIDELGMEITSGDKSGSNFVFKDLTDLTFLKRSFEPLGYDQYTAPLDKDIIKNISQWVHKSDSPANATNVNVMTAARNMALWGKREYDTFVKQMNARIADKIKKGNVDLAPLCFTWKEMMEAIRSEVL